MKDALRRLLDIGALRRPVSVVVLVLCDAGSLLAGLVAAGQWTGGTLSQALLPAPVLMVVWVAILAAYGLYDRAYIRRNPLGLLVAGLAWAGLVLVGSVIYARSGLSAKEVMIAALISLLLCASARFLFEQGVGFIYSRGLALTPVLIVGSAADREQVRRMMETAPGSYVCVGEVDPEADGLAGMRQALEDTGAGTVILSGAERMADAELLELLRSVRLRGARMRVVPGAIALMRGRPVLSENMGLPLLEVRYPRLDNTQRALKRVLDVAGALIGLAILSLPLLLAGCLVKLTSPGPVLFKQQRAGADGKVFTCYKLRSMYQGAESLQEELEARNEADGAIFKIRDDPRVTPLGSFLRRWSVDEMPQLWNVLKGEMSLVGPRPLPLRDFERMDEHHRRRLAAIPGMTGYWLISGRSDLSFEEMVRLDLHYIQNWSLSFDLKIILKTIKAVLTRKGAY